MSEVELGRLEDVGGAEASGEEEQKVLARALLAAVKASDHPDQDGPGAERGQKRSPKKSIYLTCPPLSCLYLFAGSSSLSDHLARINYAFHLHDLHYSSDYPGQHGVGVGEIH